MIKLALALGFIAVFGIVAYAIVILLINQFSNQNNKLNKKQPKQKTNANE